MIRALCIAAILLLTGCASAESTPGAPNPATSVVRSEMIARHRSASVGVVRVLVNGEPKGTGFVAERSGTIVTNFHVVQTMEKVGDQTEVRPAESIQIQFHDGQILKATWGPLSRAALLDAIARDFFILRTSRSDVPPFRIGTFSRAQPGSKIYLAGYPLGVEQPVVTSGHLSTKWEAPNYLLPGTRESAWLDATMNSGNSGGPVVLLGENPADDQVVCIATFNLNPFGSTGRKLRVFADEAGKHMKVAITGIDFPTFAKLVGSALEANSYGVGGCVSADYVRPYL